MPPSLGRRGRVCGPARPGKGLRQAGQFRLIITTFGSRIRWPSWKHSSASGATMTSVTGISMCAWLQKLLACNKTQRAKEGLQLLKTTVCRCIRPWRIWKASELRAEVEDMLPCRRCSPFRITEGQDKILDQSPGIAAIRLVHLGLSPSIRHSSPGRHRTRGSWRKMGHRASQCLRLPRN